MGNLSTVKYCVYKHTCPNGKVYIGITSKNPLERWKNGYGYKSGLFRKAIDKYGWDNIKHEILFENLAKEEAERKEVDLIEVYKSSQKEYGYNLTLGGNANIPNEETLKKLSESHKGKKASEETRRKMSERRKGMVFTDEWRKKLSEYARNRTQEHNNKISAARKNHEVSEETRRKISNSLKGNHLSEETIAKLKKSHSKKVKCIDTNQVFDSVVEASKEIGIDRSNISKCCHNVQKTAGGYRWEYINE